MGVTNLNRIVFSWWNNQLKTILYSTIDDVKIAQSEARQLFIQHHQRKKQVLDRAYPRIAEEYRSRKSSLPPIVRENAAKNKTIGGNSERARERTGRKADAYGIASELLEKSSQVLHCCEHWETKTKKVSLPERRICWMDVVFYRYLSTDNGYLPARSFSVIGISSARQSSVFLLGRYRRLRPKCPVIPMYTHPISLFNYQESVNSIRCRFNLNQANVMHGVSFAFLTEFHSLHHSTLITSSHEIFLLTRTRGNQSEWLERECHRHLFTLGRRGRKEIRLLIRRWTSAMSRISASQRFVKTT